MSGASVVHGMLRERGYRVGRQLGKGASGTVFLATTEKSGREVAIKVIAGGGEVRDAEHRRVLVANETTLSWKLFHPYLITVFETFAETEFDYVVMEYVGGGDLQPYTTPETLLPLAEVLEIARKCCIALGYASRCGVIHRDLKPANILRAGAGEIRISDFGGAIFRNLDKSAIANFGSPAFMSPEQIRGDNLDSKSDMFSFGVVLYQLLTGQLPFDAPDSQAVSFRILYDAARPVAELRPDLPPRLAAAVDRALAKLPSDRFPGWEAFGNALQPQAPADASASVAEADRENLRELGIALFDGLEPTELRAIAARYRPWSAGDVAVFQPGHSDIAFMIDGRVDISTRNGSFCASRGDIVWICGTQPQGALPGGFQPTPSARIGILSLLDLCENPALLGKLLPRLTALLGAQSKRAGGPETGDAGQLAKALVAARDQLVRVVSQLDESLRN